jgi:atypical dual specificity phosphatase
MPVMNVAWSEFKALSVTANPNLPRNFSWLEPSKIAGCARPVAESELRAVKEQGIKAIVSLTGTPLQPDVVAKLGLEYKHSPVSDFRAASPEQLKEIIRFIDEKIAQSKPVLVHCGEGKGRTGTILAAYLVSHGLGTDEAIRVIREERPGSIETVEQEDAVRRFEAHLEKH